MTMNLYARRFRRDPGVFLSSARVGAEGLAITNGEIAVVVGGYCGRPNWAWTGNEYQLLISNLGLDTRRAFFIVLLGYRQRLIQLAEIGRA